MQQRNPDSPPRGGFDEWVYGLQARGRYTFDRREASEAFGRADLALTKALGRLARRRRITSPRRGFYVIVPAEFSLPGSPPADWFIDDLMRHMGRPYYAGLLSAAALHGAAHQQPQQFQVVTDVPLRPVRVGRVKIVFVKKESVERCPVVLMNTPTGTMAVSTPEVTALDLVQYVSVAGRLNNVATVLSELAEKIAPRRLMAAVEQTGAPMSIVQRLGYLLEKIGMPEIAAPLAARVAERSPRLTALQPGRPSTESPTDARWRLRINAEVEPDL